MFRPPSTAPAASSLYADCQAATARPYYPSRRRSILATGSIGNCRTDASAVAGLRPSGTGLTWPSGMTGWRDRTQRWSNYRRWCARRPVHSTAPPDILR